MARSIAEIFAEIDGGSALNIASEKLAEVVRDVGAVEKAGSLTVTFNVKPNGEGKHFLDVKIVAKSPEKPMAASMFYATPEGDLTRRDPEQEAKLGIRAVPAAAAN